MGAKEQSESLPTMKPKHPRVLEIVAANAVNIPWDQRATAQQISFALTLGIEPTGLTKKELTTKIEEGKVTHGEKQSLIKLQQYLQKLVPDIDTMSLSRTEVLRRIKILHEDFQKRFPIGCNLSFQKGENKTSGVISRYIPTSGGLLTFYLEGQKSGFLVGYLLSATRLDAEEVPQNAATQADALRNRVQQLVGAHLKGLPVDLDAATRVTTNAVFRILKKKQYTNRSDDETIQGLIEDQKGKTY